MKFAVLSVVAVAALAISAGLASAHPPSYYGGQGYNYPPRGGHLDYHNGHFVSPLLVPVYPTYRVPTYNYGYNSGFGLTVTRPGFSFSVGSGSVAPLYNYGYRGPSCFGGPRW